MKIYLASSWKNDSSVRQLAQELRLWGYEVDCFCDDSTGRFVFHFSEIGDINEIDAITFLQDDRAKRALRRNKVIGKLLCFIGWHNWTWKLTYFGNTGPQPIILNAPPPDNAKCSRCGKPYGKCHGRKP